MTNLCKTEKITIPRDIFIQRSICESRDVINFIESQVYLKKYHIVYREVSIILSAYNLERSESLNGFDNLLTRAKRESEWIWQPSYSSEARSFIFLVNLSSKKILVNLSARAKSEAKGMLLNSHLERSGILSSLYVERSERLKYDKDDQAVFNRICPEGFLNNWDSNWDNLLNIYWK